MSSTGQYQTYITSLGIYTNNSNSLIQTSNIPSWFSVAMSSNGSIQTAGANNGRIYTSVDYGSTWLENLTSPETLWRSVAMSSDGKYQTAISNSGQIYQIIFIEGAKGATGSQGATGSKGATGSQGATGNIFITSYLSGGYTTATEIAYSNYYSGTEPNNYQKIVRFTDTHCNNTKIYNADDNSFFVTDSGIYFISYSLNGYWNSRPRFYLSDSNGIPIKNVPPLSVHNPNSSGYISTSFIVKLNFEDKNTSTNPEETSITNHRIQVVETSPISWFRVSTYTPTIFVMFQVSQI